MLEEAKLEEALEEKFEDQLSEDEASLPTENEGQEQLEDLPPAQFDGDSGEESEVEDYEQLRRRNIERNNQKLRELQLFGVSIAESASGGDRATPAPKRRKIKRAPVPTGPTRKSGRERKRSQASLDAEASERHQLEAAHHWPGANLGAVTTTL